jgi:hypothetical protein
LATKKQSPPPKTPLDCGAMLFLTKSLSRSEYLPNQHQKMTHCVVNIWSGFGQDLVRIFPIWSGFLV